MTGQRHDDTTSPDPAGSGGAIGRVTLATVVAAASGYLVLLLAARHLGAVGYGVFAVFWAAYGIVTGTQNGQLQETARALRARADTPASPDDDTAPRGRPLPVNVVIGLALAALLAATAPLWSSHVFDEQIALSVLLLAVGVASFAVYAHLAGALSGTVSWGAFAVLLIVDALTRLAGAVLAVTLGWGLTAFLIITVIGSASWCAVLLTSPTARRVVGLPGDTTARRLTSNTLTAMAAAAAAAILVMGFPVLISVTSGGSNSDDAAMLGATILAVTLTRAPLLVPLNSFQGVLITRFVDHRHRVVSALAAPVGAVVAIGVVGAGLAWLVGPWLMTTVFGADFELGGGVVAALTLGATTLAALTVTGAAALATDSHRSYAAGWWVATLTSVILLALPLDLTTRVSLALVCGPLVGIAVHLFGISRATAAVTRA